MDMITLAMAKKYTDEKAGYVEIKEGNVSFDGNVTGKNTFPGELLGAPTGSVYVHVVSHGIYGKQLKRVMYYIKGATGIIETFTYQEEEGGTMFYVDTPEFEGFPFAVAFRGAVDVADGLYVYCSSDSSVFIRVVEGELIQDIHTIDPKFIPGAVLPVLDLTSIPSEEPVQLNATEAATMDAIVSSRAEFLLATQSADGVAWVTSLRKVQVEGTVAFVGAFLAPGFGIPTAGGTFTIPTMAIVEEPGTNLWFITLT